MCIQPGVPLLHREAEHFWKPELALPQKLLPRELRYHVERFADCSSRKGMKSGQDTDEFLLCLDTAIVLIVAIDVFGRDFVIHRRVAHTQRVEGRMIGVVFYGAYFYKMKRDFP